MPRDGRHPHAEGGLVGVFDGIGDVELGAGGAEASGILGCDVNRDREDRSGADELLGGKDSGVFFFSCLVIWRHKSVSYTLSYSQIAGLNFSWMSQMLWNVSSSGKGDIGI